MGKTEKVCGIYKITSPSGKVYIGQTVDWKKRLKNYKSCSCQNQVHLYNSLMKYGYEKHKLEIIHRCAEAELNDLEIYYGELFNSRNLKTGMNIRHFGHNGRHSEETCKKIGAIHKGKTISAAQKAIISAANKGKIISDETKRKIREFRETPAEKKRMSEAATGANNGMFGRKHSEETKRKIGLKSLGRKHSEENKIKARIRMTGLVKTEQQIKNLSEAKKKIILNTDTGIFYKGVDEVSTLTGLSVTNLFGKLNGNRKNNTSFIYI